MRTRDVRSLIYLASGFGLITAIFTYLETVEASLQKYCTINSYVSCSAVANSGKTTFLGIPDSLVGVGGFILIIVVAAIAEARRRELLWPYLLLFVTSSGVAISLYFAYLEFAVIHALCPVCFTAWVFGWIAWAGTIVLVGKVRAKARARALEKSEGAPSATKSSSPSPPG
jgi:uncharacterized membrane protein